MGYDFLNRNKTILDAANQNLIVGNVVLPFHNKNPNLNAQPDKNIIPESNPPVNKNEVINPKHNFVRSLQLVIFKYKKIKVIALHIPNKFSKCKNVLFSPTDTKLAISLESSIHSPDQNNCRKCQ